MAGADEVLCMANTTAAENTRRTSRNSNRSIAHMSCPTRLLMKPTAYSTNLQQMSEKGSLLEPNTLQLPNQKGNSQL
jgi:hypothetical protein